MNPILIIPARMAASRLPGKPLADIGGVPMIVRVWARAMAAGSGIGALASEGAMIWTCAPRAAAPASIPAHVSLNQS